MRRLWTLVLLVSLGLNIGLGVRLLRSGGEPGIPGAGPGPRDGGGPGWERGADADSTVWRRFMDRRLAHLSERLDLRPEQVDAFRDAHVAMEGQLRATRRELFAARSRMRGLIAEGEIEGPAIRGAMAEIGRRQAEMDSLAAETLLRELMVLDPDQREAYLEFVPRGAGRGGRGGRGGGPRSHGGGPPGR